MSDEGYPRVLEDTEGPAKNEDVQQSATSKDAPVSSSSTTTTTPDATEVPSTPSLTYQEATEKARTSAIDKRGMAAATAVMEPFEMDYLSLWAWKRRSGWGQYATTSDKWEQRSVVVCGTFLLYYQMGQEDGVPRGVIDLARDKVELQVSSKLDKDAPTTHQVDVTAKQQLADVVPPREKIVTWKLCFDEQLDLVRFLGVVNTILDQGGAFEAKDIDRFEHDFHAGDHIYRWEMIVCPPVIYPIQIHGIVLEAGRNAMVVADFGLTGYGRKQGQDFNHADEHHDNAVLAAWRKMRPNDVTQRLHIVMLTDQYEIRKWTKAGYDEESRFAVKKHNYGQKTVDTISSLFKAKSTDQIEGGDGDGNLKASKSTDSGSPSKADGAGYDGVTNPQPSQAHQELPQSDPTEIVLARANYVLEHMEVLPPYHVFYSNSECIAVWCKTGRWSTLQTAVFLSTNSVGALKSSTVATLGVAAAAPWIAPVVAIGGLIWVSAPMVILQKSREKWAEATQQLTDLFWAWAPPAVFVSAIRNWSGLARGEDASSDGAMSRSSSKPGLAKGSKSRLKSSNSLDAKDKDQSADVGKAMSSVSLETEGAPNMDEPVETTTTKGDDKDSEESTPQNFFPAPDSYIESYS